MIPSHPLPSGPDLAALRKAAQKVVDTWNPIVSLNVPPTLNRDIAALELALDLAVLAANPEPRDGLREALARLLGHYRRDYIEAHRPADYPASLLYHCDDLLAGKPNPWPIDGDAALAPDRDAPREPA